MQLWEVIVVVVGLGLDAFAIAIYRGSNQVSLSKKTIVLVGIIFGVIQSIMLALGMLIAIFPLLNIESEKIILINRWFSAIILIYLSIKFFKSSFEINNIQERREKFFGYRGSVVLAFATSIDSLILGVGLGLLRTNIVSNILILFIITSILVALGLWIGYYMGNKYKKQADVCGGIILLAIGIKIIFDYFSII